MPGITSRLIKTVIGYKWLIYSDIYNWLSMRNEPDIVDNRTDVEKAQSAGFDKITSFRNM